MDNIVSFNQRISQLSNTTKFVVLFVSITLVAAVVYLFVRIGSEEYAVLFSQLDTKDAGVIVQQLEKAKVDYRLEDRGATILVPAATVHEHRLKVMNAVPSISGGVGFEIFDKDNFGTTEFAQKINFQRALQGELSRTISSINGVKSARVHLVLPDSSIFNKKRNDTQASVTLTLAEKVSLSPKQVSGIQKLVASASPGMKPEDVAILNQKGVMLSPAQSDGYNIAAANKILQTKQEIERYLISKAQAVLDNAFGTGRAYVAVDVTMDFNNIKKTREQIISSPDKEQNVARKKEIRSTAKGSNKGNDVNATLEVDYELGKEVEQIVHTPGAIERLSVAIVVPSEVKDEQIGFVQTVVGNAVGYHTSRGDEMAVTRSQLRPASLRREETSSSASFGMMNSVDKVKEDGASEAAAPIARAPDRRDPLFSNGLASIAHYIEENYYTSAIFVLSALVLIVALGWLMAKRLLATSPRNNENPISNEERERLLHDLKGWLSAER